MCSEDLDRVNLPQSATAAGWETETDLDGILCVVHDNSASLGGFYRDPTASSALSAEEVGTELKRYGVRAYDDCVVGTDAYCEQGASGIVYTGDKALLKVTPSAAPQLAPCASSGRAWRLWAARPFPE